MGLNISFEVEVCVVYLVLTIDVADTVKGVINFFGDVEPKSIGDNDEDKIFWYMKVFLSTNLFNNSRQGSISVLEIPSYDVKRFPNVSVNVYNLVSLCFVTSDSRIWRYK